LLSDLFHKSRFGSKEIEKERQVVMEEIRMVQDDPEDLVQESHIRQVMGPHPLSRPILGQESTIKRLRRPDLLNFKETHYRPEEMVIAVAGNFNQSAMEKTIDRHFDKTAKSSRPSLRKRWPPELCGGVRLKRKPLEQVHLCVGLNGFPAGHKDRYAAYVVNSVMGGSVSSRLFQEVREKRGLAYSIYSFLSGYSDAGTMTVCAATRSAELERVLDLIRREIRRMVKKGIEQAELQRTKDQMKGSLMLSLESSHSRMNKLAKDELIAGAHTSLQDMISDIDAVTGEQVHRVAQEILAPQTMAITGLGPLSSSQLSLR